MSRLFINHIGTYNDNHKDITINVNADHAADVLRTVMAEEVTDEAKDYFRYITQKCIDEKRAEAVEAEIRAACQGTAEGLWRTLWNNENLGFVVVQPIDATTLYRELEKRYGKLPFKERQFRSARNNR